MLSKITDANLPIFANGATYHLGCKAGQLSNRILTAGDPARIRRIATLLDSTPIPFENVSSRGFTVITGCYKTIPVTLIAIGMGAPMADFMVRESRAVIEGDMAIIRIGSCGSLDPSFPAGGVSVAESALAITTNYDYWHAEEGEKEAKHAGDKEEKGEEELDAYHFSKPIPADVELTTALFHALKSSGGALNQVDVRSVKLHASAEFFYSTQGRTDPSFLDDNENLLSELSTIYPTLSTLEMETTQLYHLAKIHRPNPEKKKGNLYAAACHINFIARAEKGENSTVEPALLVKLEPAVGEAVLKALIGFKLDNVHPTNGSVWEVGVESVPFCCVIE